MTVTKKISERVEATDYERARKIYIEAVRLGEQDEIDQALKNLREERKKLPATTTAA